VHSGYPQIDNGKDKQMNKISDYFGDVERFDPQLSVEPRRELRVGKAEQVYFTTTDGVQIRLTRYQGGAKGPVILSHCIGVSSLMYAIDTIDENLLEYLYRHAFDVWLLDHRLSIELPASYQQSSMDDVATKDYPAAVQKVRELTGAEAVQVVAHGVGASTLSMALLSGLQGVNAAVCSQVSMHLYSIDVNIRKARLPLPKLLRLFGKKWMTAYTDVNVNFLTKLYDGSMVFMPVPAHERCNNVVCHRISSIFGELYEHSQLNPATHRALARMFGRVNLTAMQQLTAILLKNHLIDAAGNDVYLPHVDKLKLPMLFISGSNNDCVLPKSTQQTFDLLCSVNDPQLYSRAEIPAYGHVDCIIGQHAAKDVYPHILKLLESR